MPPAGASPVPGGARVLMVGKSVGSVRSLWQRHLGEQGFDVQRVTDSEAAIALLRDESFDVVVLDLVSERGSAFAVSDYASFRHPGTALIFVNSDDFLAGGVIFSLCSNACMVIPARTAPPDLAAIVAHYARTACAA